VAQNENADGAKHGDQVGAKNAKDGNNHQAANHAEVKVVPAKANVVVNTY
jgi:hypothetical protein